MGLDTELQNFTHDNLNINILRDWKIFKAISQQSLYPEARDFHILLTYRTTKTLIKNIDWKVADELCNICYLNSLDLNQRHDTFVQYNAICSGCLNSSKYCIYNPDAVYDINRNLCDTCRGNGYTCDGDTVLCNLMTLYHNYPNRHIPECPVHKYDINLNELIDDIDIKETINTPDRFPKSSMLVLLTEKIKKIYTLSKANLDCAAYRSLMYLERCPALVYY